jgi:hypothetical protein
VERPASADLVSGTAGGNAADRPAGSSAAGGGAAGRPARGSSAGRPAAGRAAASPRLAWAAYAACGWGLVFGAVSFYWASGGTLGADTIGGSIEQLASSGDSVIFLALWVTGLLKVAGAVLALALVRSWGAELPRRVLLVLGWAVAAVLTSYGGVLVAGEALVAARVVRPSAPVAWTPLLWHLYLWDMSFLVWGILFGLAVWGFAARGPASRGSGTGRGAGRSRRRDAPPRG